MQSVFIGPSVVGGIGGAQNINVSNYRHIHSATVGFDRCTFRITEDADTLQRMFYSTLGGHVVRYAEDGNGIVWQGFVNKITFNQPGKRISLSLDDLHNKVIVKYTELNTATNPPGETTGQVTSSADNTISQDIYGVKELIYKPPFDKMIAAAAQDIRDVLLGQYAFPKRSSQLTYSGGNSYSLAYECLGYMHTLKWRSYTNTGVTGNITTSTLVDRIVAACGEFISKSVVDLNGASVQEYYGDYETAYNLLQYAASLGDSNGDRWLVIVEDDRTLKYRQASDMRNRDLFLRVAGNKLEYTDVSGQRVPNWRIRANTLVSVPDYSPYESVKYYIQTEGTDDKRIVFAERVEWTEDNDRLKIEGSLSDRSSIVVAQAASQGVALV